MNLFYREKAEQALWFAETRTHIIESCAKTLDSRWKVTRTPGVAQGAELPLKLLLEGEIRKHVL